MENDYTQDLIDEVKGCLGEPTVSTDELETELASYSPKQYPINVLPACSSSVTLMPNDRVIPRTYETEWLPFAISPPSGAIDDSEEMKNLILASLRNFFDVGQFRNMYTQILESNGLMDSTRQQAMQNADLIDFFYEFLKIEVRSTDYMNYCTLYTLQRLPRTPGDSDLLVHKFKMSWVGSDANTYYTIITVTFNARPAYTANQLEATDIAVEGSTASAPVIVTLDSDMDTNDLVNYIRDNAQTLIETARDTYGCTDTKEFAQTVQKFDVSFVYNSIEGGAYGETHTRTVTFTRRSFFMDKPDQWTSWPLYYDFAYRGVIDDGDRSRVADISCIYNQQDVLTIDVEYSCQTGVVQEVMWD